MYGHTEADVSSQCLLEANVSTEVCLTVLDTLSIFIMGFKVWPKAGLSFKICHKTSNVFFTVWFVGFSDSAELRPGSQPPDEESFPGAFVLPADPSV